MELQQQRQANTRFCSRKADRENVHNLTIRLTPIATGDHKGQRRSINHDFQADQHKQQIAADNQTRQPENE
ncbi:hypothetical protein D1872_338550 [compost metagenome]